MRRIVCTIKDRLLINIQKGSWAPTRHKIPIANIGGHHAAIILSSDFASLGLICRNKSVSS